MQFPSFFKKKAQQPEETSSQRIEPQIGGEGRAASAEGAEPPSWEEKPAVDAPAFEVVSDERTARPAGTQEPKLSVPAAPQVSAESSAAPAPEPPVLSEPGAAPQPAAPKPAPAEAAAPVQGAEEAPTRRKLGDLFRSAAHRSTEPSQPPSEEEIEMRQKTRYRLAGAAAILIAVIVVAPFVLDRENAADEAQVSTAIPPVPDKARTTLAPPAPEEKAAETADAKAAADAEAARKAEEAKAAEQARAEEEAKAAAAAKAEQERAEQAARQKAADQAKAKQEAAKKEAAKKQAAAAAPSGKGWYVQVMATRSERTASQLVAKLKGQGFPAYSVSGKDSIIRVRVGLYKSKNAAQGAQGTLALNGYTGKLIVGAQ
jgi:cell division septation protein DedD